MAEDVLAAETTPELRPLGPDSLFWKYMGDARIGLMAGRAIVLQDAHPVVGAGVEEHSTYKTDPYGRATRTREAISRLVYGGEEALATGAWIRQRHKDIKGVDDKGRRYSALNPVAYSWVHATLYEWLLETQRVFGKPLTEEQAAQLFAEWRQLGFLLGMRDKDMPADVPAFWTYWWDMVNNRLEDNVTVRYFLAEGLIAKEPPPGSRIPMRLWLKMRSGLLVSARRTIATTLPPVLITRLGLTVTEKDVKRLIGFVGLVKLVTKVTPSFLRTMPDAAKARRQAKRRPRTA